MSDYGKRTPADWRELTMHEDTLVKIAVILALPIIAGGIFQAVLKIIARL